MPRARNLIETYMAPTQDLPYDLWGPVQNEIVKTLVQKSIKGFKMAIAEY